MHSTGYPLHSLNTDRNTGIATLIASHPPFSISINHRQSEFHQSSSWHPILHSSSYGFGLFILILSQFQIHPLMDNQKERSEVALFFSLTVKNDCMR